MSDTRYLLLGTLPHVQEARFHPEITQWHTGTAVPADVGQASCASNRMLRDEGFCASTLGCRCGLMCLTAQ